MNTGLNPGSIHIQYCYITFLASIISPNIGHRAAGYIKLYPSNNLLLKMLTKVVIIS